MFDISVIPAGSIKDTRLILLVEHTYRIYSDYIRTVRMAIIIRTIEPLPLAQHILNIFGHNRMNFCQVSIQPANITLRPGI